MRSPQQNEKHYRHDVLMRYARQLGFGDIHVKMDKKTGLHSIIAIHSTKRGPAIGGCRFYDYNSSDHAIKDALRLSYMMTLKAAITNLPHGGAKAVILKPKEVKDHDALFRAFGDFVHEMNGRYITAMDVGTSAHEMDIIAERTPHVIGASSVNPLHGDPSPFTAIGVFKGMQAAVQFKLGRDTLDGLKVAIQGAGKVGYHLAKLLHDSGAAITVCDPKKQASQRFVDDFNAKVVPLDSIYDVPCDIFAPCALGGTINLDTIQRITANIIVGSANNQLAHRKYGKILHEKGVLYAPDFLVNAGGLIQAATVHDHHNIDIAQKLVNQLYDRSLVLFERAQSENKPTFDIAELIALEKLRTREQQTVEIT